MPADTDGMGARLRKQVRATSSMEFKLVDVGACFTEVYRGLWPVERIVRGAASESQLRF